MTKVLALATCFNRKEKTLKAVNSLINGNKMIDFHFIICDDNSSDGTKEELDKISNVETVNGTGSLYWCGGMRRAIDVALNRKEEYDYCLFFNDDVDFFDNSIEKLVNKEKSIVWVGPTCNNNSELTYGGVIKTSTIRPKYKTVISDNSSGTKCDTFNGNCVLIPWNVFKEIGNMDKVYTHQFGDFDYGFSITKKGYEIRVSNEYIGICNVNSNKGTFSDTSLSIKERLSLKKTFTKGLPTNEWFHFLNKNYNIFTAIVYSISPYIKILLKK